MALAGVENQVWFLLAAMAGVLLLMVVQEVQLMAVVKAFRLVLREKMVSLKEPPLPARQAGWAVTASDPRTMVQVHNLAPPAV